VVCVLVLSTWVHQVELVMDLLLSQFQRLDATLVRCTWLWIVRIGIVKCQYDQRVLL
jgi:hypothetical protein